jgi:hypothetical protein
MQMIERPLPRGEIVYYVECLLNSGETADQYLLVECTSKAQAISLAKLMSITNDIYTEDRPHDVV